MRYVVLDTNALIQALPTKSRYHKIWTDFLEGFKISCYLCSEIIVREYGDKEV